MKTIKFQKLLNEGISGSKLIVVDIQPAYEKEVKRIKSKFIKDLINFNGNVLYLYNGPDMGYHDDEGVIENWIREETDDWDVDLENIEFVEKGYGFFRDVTDGNYDESDIIELIGWMIKNDKYDVRDIDEDDLKNIIDDEDLIHEILNERVFLALPQFDIDILKKFKGASICGGGKNECLAEVQILLAAMKIKTKVINKYVY